MTLEYYQKLSVQQAEIIKRLRDEEAHYKLALQAQARGIERLRKRSYRYSQMKDCINGFESLIRRYFEETPDMPIFKYYGSIDTTQAATKLWILGKSFLSKDSPLAVERGRSYEQFGLS